MGGVCLKYLEVLLHMWPLQVCELCPNLAGLFKETITGRYMCVDDCMYVVCVYVCGMCGCVYV